VRTNSYSVPLKPGSIVEARVTSTTVEFRHHGNRIASHERCYSRLQKIFDLEHYLEVLDRKPGALRGSTPLAQWRTQGRWPESYDRLWERRTERQGRQGGTRAMVTLIRMGREFGYEKLATAVEQALDLGCGDVAAIRTCSCPISCSMRSARRSRSAPCPHTNVLCDHDRVRRLFSGAVQRCRHEPPDCKHRSALQGSAAGCRRSAVRIARRRSRSAQPLASVLSGALLRRRWRSGTTRIELRMKEAHLPRIKTLEEFDFAQSPHIRPPASRPAEGGYLERAEPVLLVGDPGTGKSHLATAWLSRLSSTQASALYDSRSPGEPARRSATGAESEPHAGPVVRVELIVIDELGYVR